MCRTVGLNDLFRCVCCTAITAELSSGWAVVNGKFYCPEHAAGRRDRDGIDQRDAAAPEAELRDVSDALKAWEGDTAELEPSGEHEL